MLENALLRCFQNGEGFGEGQFAFFTRGEVLQFNERSARFVPFGRGEDEGVLGTAGGGVLEEFSDVLGGFVAGGDGEFCGTKLADEFEGGIG